MHYKKPTILVGGIAGGVIILLAACFLTNPKEGMEKQLEETMGNEQMAENNTVVSETIDISESSDITGNAVGEDTQTEGEILKEPPNMNVQDALSSTLSMFELEKNSFEWNYPDESVQESANGEKTQEWTSIATGSLFPTSAAKQTEWLRLPEYQRIEAWPYLLTCEVLPDMVTVKEYSIFDLGNAYAEVLSEKTYTKDMLFLDLIPGRIYEVTAVWDESNREKRGYYGSVGYILVTDTEFETEEDGKKYESQMMNAVTITAHIKEKYPYDIILISSDTDDFPGTFEVRVPEAVYDMEELEPGASIEVEMYDTGTLSEDNRLPVYTATALHEFAVCTGKAE